VRSSRHACRHSSHHVAPRVTDLWSLVSSTLPGLIMSPALSPASCMAAMAPTTWTT
jgi:hypothetical protein